MDMNCSMQHKLITLGCFLVLFLSISLKSIAEVDGEFTSQDFPIPAWIDEAKVQTSLRLNLTVASIEKSLEEWIKSKHELPEDQMLSDLLSAIQQKNSEKLKDLVWYGNFKMVDAPEFMENMHRALYRDGYHVQILGKTYTNSGVLYSLGLLGPKSTAVTVKLRLIDPLTKGYKCEVVAENSITAMLLQVFDLQSGVSGKKSGVKRFEPENLAEVFGRAIITDNQTRQGIRDCIDLITSSETTKGITEGSRGVIADQISSFNTEKKQTFVKDFNEHYKNLEFIINANPLYIAFFKSKNGWEHASFVRQGSEFQLTNYYRITPIDEYLSNEFAKTDIFTHAIEAAQSATHAKTIN